MRVRADGQIRRKLVIVGDGAAGKTSLLNVFAVGHFPESYVSILSTYPSRTFRDCRFLNSYSTFCLTSADLQGADGI